jgi:hypothetical protein
VLPLTRLLYNNTAAWYHNAAATSNRGVDQAIQRLAGLQGLLGDTSALSASALQELVLRSIVATSSGFNSDDHVVGNGT